MPGCMMLEVDFWTVESTNNETANKTPVDVN